MGTNLKIKSFVGLALVCVGCLWINTTQETIEASRLGVTHLGTFDGSTTFTTSSSNGVNPGLFIEIIDDYGKLTQYESEEGIITIPNTKEGAYVTQAKLLGKTKYLDQDTGEILDVWEDGRRLQLVSVENPTLITNGHNLCDGIRTYNGVNDIYGSNFIKVEPGKSYGIYQDDKNFLRIDGYTMNKEHVTYISGGNVGLITIPLDVEYIKWRYPLYGEAYDENSKIMIALSSKKLTLSDYKPYEINNLSITEEVILRGIGEVRDEFNLMTGELIKSIEEIVLNGTENWVGVRESEGYRMNINTSKLDRPKAHSSCKVLMDKFAKSDWSKGVFIHPQSIFYYTIPDLMLTVNTLTEAKSYLSNHPVTVQYYSEENTVKLTNLRSTYNFPLLNKSFVQLKGEATPVITSITVPSQSLTFTLDPNQEAGQQFIAPEFDVTNESNAPLNLTLKTFEQTTDVLNDVLPSEHDSWDGLTKEESKDIALGLVAQSSDDWLSVVETPHYVSETNNEFVGIIKPKGTVGFEFTAHHGQAFDEILNPSYHLTFVFDLLN